MSSSGMTSMTLRTVDSTNARTTRARYCRYLTQSWVSGWEVGVCAGGACGTSAAVASGPRLVVVLAAFGRVRRVGGVGVVVVLVVTLVVRRRAVEAVVAARAVELALQSGEVG